MSDQNPVADSDKKFRITIKRKLIILVLIVLVIVSGISFTFVITWGIRDYSRDLENRMRLHARLIGEYCISPLVFNDIQGVNEMLTKIKSLPEISSALVFDEKDSLVALYSTSNQKFFEKVKRKKLLPGFRDDVFIVSEPVQYQGSNLGSIILIASTDSLRKQVKAYAILLACTMLTLIILGYFLTSWLQGFISKPILRLSNFANLISRGGDYSLRIDKKTNDEIGQLYDRFNEMLEKIRIREQELIEAEKETRLSNEKLSLILDHAPFGFLHFDRDGIVTTCNKGHEKIFNLKKEDLIGKSLYDTIKDEVMKKSMDDALHGTPCVYSDKYTSTLSGKSVYIRAIYTPLLSDDGKILGGIGIFEDISEQKRVERLQVEKEAAVFANKAKSIFLANMSHEIRTPLNAILGFAQLMEKDPMLSPDQKENVSIINSSGEHLLALINSVLEMSKIEAGRIQLNNTTFNLHSMIEEVIGLFRIRASEKNLYLLCEREEDVPAYISADEGKLRQVLINLLSNAVKFTAEGGINVRIWTMNSAGENHLLNVEVIDTGAGIAESEADKVFMHFEQTRSGQMAHAGTGLGLAICKEYVRMMNGEISFKSALDKGTVFRFYVEIEPGDASQVTVAEKRAIVTGIEEGERKISVLVVDDKEPNRKLLVKMFGSVGFEVDSAADGLDAVEKFKCAGPDLIMMDMFMPVMDGFEAIKMIRSMPGGKDVVIFAVTASVFEEDKDSILGSGADEFIGKPFKEYEIFDKISGRMNIRFIYATDEKNPDQSEAKPELTPESMRSLPSEIFNAMQQALARGDLEAMKEHLDHIPDANKDLAGPLLMMIRSFDLNRLNELFGNT